MRSWLTVGRIRTKGRCKRGKRDTLRGCKCYAAFSDWLHKAVAPQYRNAIAVRYAAWDDQTVENVKNDSTVFGLN